MAEMTEIVAAAQLVATAKAAAEQAKKDAVSATKRSEKKQYDLAQAEANLAKLVGSKK